MLLLAALSAGVALGLNPEHRADWAVELIMPALMVAACLIGHRWFVFTRLAYWLILVHVLVQLWGGHFTYTQEPIFEWLKERFALSRNHYDRLAHFAVGFLLFVPIREMVLRLSKVSRGWACFFTMAVISGVAGLWEVFEWLVVALQPELDVAYLGLQGDPWDAQKDIILALVGALAAWPLFVRAHDAALKKAAANNL